MALLATASGFGGILLCPLSCIFLTLIASSWCLPVPIAAPGLQLNTPTTVVLRQGHSITADAIRQELDSETLRLLSFAKPNRILSHLGIRGSLGEASLVLNRRPQNVGERQDIQSPFVFPNEGPNVQSIPPPTSEPSKETPPVEEQQFSPEQTTEVPTKTTELPIRTSPDKFLEELMTYGRGNKTAEEEEDSYKLGYSVDEGQIKRFRYEEKTPEGLIVGEFGIHKGNGDGIIRGVRYTAEAGVHPKVLYEALVKFLSL